MKCNKCMGKTTVCDTTHTKENETYRRRICLVCGSVFFTMEFEVDANAEFKKEWRKSHRSTVPSRPKELRKKYTIYLRKNDHIVASGTAEECAKQMGTSIGSFYAIASRAKSGKTKKYEIYSSYDDDVELEEK